MARVWLIAVLCTAAFGDTITYNYTGNTFSECNGIVAVNGNCPANYLSDRNLASLTFSAPLASNLSSVDPTSLPTLLGWTTGDQAGAVSFSSADAAAAAFKSFSLSTGSDGAISGWQMNVETPGFVLSNGTTGDAAIGINNPPFTDANGFPEADFLIANGGNAGPGYNLGNGLTGSWTESLNGFEGGPTSAPVFFFGGDPVAEVTGTISGLGAEEYYGFYWGGGAFNATASITGASAAGSYLFTEGAAATCLGGASQTLNSGDSFTSTIAIANLAPGQYCIGIDANSANDPNYSLTFNTPVSPVPEPSSFVPLFAALGMLGILRCAKRSRRYS